MFLSRLLSSTAFVTWQQRHRAMVLSLKYQALVMSLKYRVLVVSLKYRVLVMSLKSGNEMPVLYE